MSTVATPAAPIEAQLAAANSRGIYAISQLRALLIIRRTGQISLTDLATELGLTTSAITIMADALTHARYITRSATIRSERTGLIDRRKFALTLTETGHKALLNILTA